jgi:hypothetical protein
MQERVPAIEQARYSAGKNMADDAVVFAPNDRTIAGGASRERRYRQNAL